MTNTINSNTSKIYVLGHADSDGRYAMWCAHNHFRNTQDAQNLVMHEVQYNQPIPLDFQALTKNDTVFILDFSYKADVLTKLAALVGKLVVLDHHKSSADELNGLQEKLQDLTNVLIHFDMTKSGALLAWEYFNPGKEEPYPCKLVNDRDLWQFKHGDETRALECYIRAFGEPSSMQWWDKLHGMSEDGHEDTDWEFLFDAMKMGYTCLQYERKTIANFAKNPSNWKTVTIEHNGMNYSGVVYEGMGILHSELAEHFYTTMDIDFTLEWRRKVQDQLVFSLRSPRIDVSKLAVQKGGGGHVAAAGFTMPLTQGFEFVSRLTLTDGVKSW